MYMREKLDVAVALAKTGVKMLHAVAVQYDVGIYFEANGHGSITFSPKCLSSIKQACQAASGEVRQAAAELHAIVEVCCSLAHAEFKNASFEL
jgi:phosphoacetylglucosamine mutase